MRLRNNGSNVGPTSLLQILISEMGKGRRAIEKIERGKNCVKRDQSPCCGEGSDGREPLKSVVVSDKPLPLPWLW